MKLTYVLLNTYSSKNVNIGLYCIEPMKIYALLGLLILFTLTSPVTAQTDEMYTAIMDISLQEIVQSPSYAVLVLDYDLEVWNEGERIVFNKSVEELYTGNCPVYWIFEGNFTEDRFGSSGYSGDFNGRYSDPCILPFVPDDIPSYSTARNLWVDDYIFNKGLNYRYNNSLILYDWYPNVTKEPSLPDGEMNFTITTEPARWDHFGHGYGISIELQDNSYNITYEEIPQDFGTLSNKTEEFLHFRMINIRFREVYYSRDSKFTFLVKSNYLNTGEDKKGPDIGKHSGTGLNVMVDIERTRYTSYYFFGTVIGDYWYDPILYHAETRTEYNTHYSIIINHQSTSILPDGEVEFLLNIRQNENNTFKGYIHSKDGEITYSYDELPDFWYDFDPTTIESTLISYPWSGLIILVPLIRIKSLMKKSC